MDDLFITTLRVRPLRSEVAARTGVDLNREYVEVTCYGQTIAVVNAEQAEVGGVKSVLWVDEHMDAKTTRTGLAELVSLAVRLMAATKANGLTKVPA